MRYRRWRQRSRARPVATLYSDPGHRSRSHVDPALRGALALLDIAESWIVRWWVSINSSLSLLHICHYVQVHPAPDAEEPESDFRLLDVGGRPPTAIPPLPGGPQHGRGRRELRDQSQTLGGPQPKLQGSGQAQEEDPDWGESHRGRAQHRGRLRDWQVGRHGETFNNERVQVSLCDHTHQELYKRSKFRVTPVRAYNTSSCLQVTCLEYITQWCSLAVWLLTTTSGCGPWSPWPLSSSSTCPCCLTPGQRPPQLLALRGRSPRMTYLWVHKSGIETLAVASLFPLSFSQRKMDRIESPCTRDWNMSTEPIWTRATRFLPASKSQSKIINYPSSS